jgi:hypothetical protein
VTGVLTILALLERAFVERPVSRVDQARRASSLPPGVR